MIKKKKIKKQKKPNPCFEYQGPPGPQEGILLLLRVEIEKWKAGRPSSSGSQDGYGVVHNSMWAPLKCAAALNLCEQGAKQCSRPSDVAPEVLAYKGWELCL